MTNNPYFTLTFFTRKPRSEGYTDHKVYVRISVAGQQTDLAIGRSVNPENWDQKRKLSKGRSRRDLELNKYLDEIRARFCEIHTNLVREKKLVNPIVMRDLFLGKVEKPKMLCEIFTESNAKRKEEMERGDMVNATYLRWERYVTYLGEFLRLTMNVDDNTPKYVLYSFDNGAVGYPVKIELLSRHNEVFTNAAHTEPLPIDGEQGGYRLICVA